MTFRCKKKLNVSTRKYFWDDMKVGVSFAEVWHKAVVNFLIYLSVILSIKGIGDFSKFWTKLLMCMEGRVFRG